MKRREFIALVGSAAAAWPAAGRAQQATMPVVGILGSPTAKSYASRMTAFMEGLRETGFIEGQNVIIEYHWANNAYDRLPDMAADLVRRQVSLIAAIGNNLPARAAKGATITIPIVFLMGADPVQLGLVASLNSPSGNITGVTTLAVDQVQKRIQLLHDLVPTAKVFGLLINPDNLFSSSSAGRNAVELAQDAARIWGGTIQVAHVRTAGDFDAALASVMGKGAQALATASDALFTSGRKACCSRRKTSDPYDL